MSSQTNTEVEEKTTNTGNEAQVTDSKNPFKELTIEKIKATKKQLKQEDQAYKFCDENSFRINEKEFDALMSGKGKWLQTSSMFTPFLWGEYLTLPEGFIKYAKVYVLTYDASKEGYISTSFWAYYDHMLFRAYNLEKIQEIFEHLKAIWLYEFREYVQDELENNEAAQNHS